MLKQITIMLGKAPEERGHVKPGLDSFVKDVMTSGNKTAPKPEMHAKLAKMLRGECGNQEMPVSEWDGETDNIMAKILKKFYGRH